MPCFRGLDMSIVVQPQSQRLPELPHPDGSSVHVLLSPDSSPSLEDQLSFLSVSEPSRLQKANPRVSVYIPSIPGAQFMIDYEVLSTPEPPCHFYFKLFVNGRHITSWGINPTHEPSGTVSRALYEPCERWHYEENGTVFKTEVVECRSFFFSPSPSSGSVADDGGLIEVHVYRAKGKRRRAMRLERFRNQDRYGILSPSSGLLERPESTAYYDWDLIDPRDSPFSSFRFHYRDWNILHQLNLIPNKIQQTDESYPLSSNPQKQSWVQERYPAESLFEGDELDISSSRGEYLAFEALESSDPTTKHSDRRCGVESAADTLDASRLLKKSSESLATSTSTAPSVAPSLLPYVEDSSDESFAELGIAVGLQLRGRDPQSMREKRPLPEIPKKYRQSEESSAASPAIDHSHDEDSLKSQAGAESPGHGGDLGFGNRCDGDKASDARRLGRDEAVSAQRNQTEEFRDDSETF